MSLIDLASLGSFVSGLAVLVSLIYLAVQVQQSRKHMAAQISQSRVQFGAQQQDAYVADPAIVDIMLRGARADPDLSEVEGFRFWFIVSNTFLMIEDEFRQYDAGLISSARHNGFVKRISRAFRLPGYRAAWTLQREGFEADFQEFMDQIVQKGRESGLPPDNTKAWQAAIAAEHDGQSQ